MNARGPPGSSSGTTATTPYWLSSPVWRKTMRGPSVTSAMGVCSASGSAARSARTSRPWSTT